MLVADPAMGDPRFARTVIFLVRHDRGGAVGLIVNRPIGDLPLRELLSGDPTAEAAGDARVAVHYGGPVEGRLGFILHSLDYQAAGSAVVQGKAAVTTNPEVLLRHAQGEAPRRILFALGYAGWAPGQLEGEIERGDWLVIPGETALIFDRDHAGKWRKARERRVQEL